MRPQVHILLEQSQTLHDDIVNPLVQPFLVNHRKNELPFLDRLGKMKILQQKMIILYKVKFSNFIIL